MKKLALTAVLAAALATAGTPTTPARADGGATAAIIIGSVILGGILWHSHGGAGYWAHPWPYHHPWFAPPPPPPPPPAKRITK